MNTFGKIVSLGLVLLTVLGVAYLLRDGMRDFDGKNRAVVVRGLSEREVKADMAIWPFMLTATDNDLATAQNILEVQEAAVRNFLKDNGLDVTKDLSVMRFGAQDLLAQQYRPEGIERGRYVLSKTLLLRTAEVDKVMTASQAMDTLVKQNVALGDGSAPSYVFTRLNDVKPEMIKEATANAYHAANQFATDSGAHVGNIITASQGVFSIDGRDEIPMLGAEGQLNKKVRVVTSVTYKLD